MSGACNNCGAPNPHPQYVACADCRAAWRAAKGKNPQKRISKYQALFEDAQTEIARLKKANAYLRAQLVKASGKVNK